MAEIAVTDTGLVMTGYAPSRVLDAMCDWLRFHGLDPNLVPIDTPIVRDLEHRAVRCRYFVLGQDGLPDVDHAGHAVTIEHVAQGETPPLPWPDVVLEFQRAS